MNRRAVRRASAWIGWVERALAQADPGLTGVPATQKLSYPGGSALVWLTRVPGQVKVLLKGLMVWSVFGILAPVPTISKCRLVRVCGRVCGRAVRVMVDASMLHSAGENNQDRLGG
ncbi:hypothetical protein F4777DRAFT_531132 [Nemania sp. FL0916]|nr:hypothetical protein F4777DRAFT_531132 [Nemania sp. FL0916]